MSLNSNVNQYPALSAFRSSVAVIKRHHRPYVVINVLFYGLIIAGSVVSAVHPPLQKDLLASLQSEFERGTLAPVAEAYRSGNVASAALQTFWVNSVIGAFASITLPSALIPFSGCPIGLYRAVLWGLALSPANRTLRLAMIPHSLTLVLEGQAYVLALFGCYLWGKWVLSPSRSGFSTARQGYLAGLRANLRLYSLILSFLAVAAVYEAVEVIAMRSLL